MSYYQKYLKYKNKYLVLKKQLGGDLTDVNIYYNGTKIDGINLSDLDEDDSTNYLITRIMEYLNSSKRSEVFEDIPTINEDNIVLYVGTTQNLANKINRESSIKNNTDYSFILQHITPTRVPTKIESGFKSLVGVNKPFIRLQDGTEYHGEIVDGIPHGYGTETKPNGYKYEGLFNLGRKEGHGKETLPDGYTYSGGFKDNIRNGYGEIVQPDGYTYKGEFKDGYKDGNGKETYIDGYTYEGDFKDNIRNGHGKIVQPDGYTYEGQLKDDIPNGKGKETYEDGYTYEGEFKNAIPNGKGKVIQPDIYTCEGEFRNGKLNGDGKREYYYGGKDEGIFENNILIKGTTIRDLGNGNVYEGPIDNGKRNGHGIVKNYRGYTIFEGEFKDGKIDYRHQIQPYDIDRFINFFGLQRDKRIRFYLNSLECEYKNNNDVKFSNHPFGILDTYTIIYLLKNKHFTNNYSGLDPDDVNPEWENFRADLENRLANKTLENFKSSGNDIDGEDILSFIRSTTNIFIQKVIQAHLISLSDADLSNPTTWANATNFKFKSDFNDIFGDIVNVGINIKPEPKSFSYRQSISGDLIAEDGSLV